MEDILNLIVNNGVAIAVVAFYMIRDWRYTDSLNITLTTLVETVESLKEWVQKEKEK